MNSRKKVALGAALVIGLVGTMNTLHEKFNLAAFLHEPDLVFAGRPSERTSLHSTHFNLLADWGIVAEKRNR